MILGKVMGPWTLSYHVYNVQEFLMDTIADPDRVRKSLDTLSEVPILFAKAQLEAGADAIVWADHATGDLIRNTMYRDFLSGGKRETGPAGALPGDPALLRSIARSYRIFPGNRIRHVPLRIGQCAREDGRRRRGQDPPGRQHQQPPGF
ncbi:MAG: hypothetical protein CM1200mP20_10410 [Pseudomonadota bacterium]|nr:MAG: hypothetical protein CM1200mP20_10410 [Pseudomonadota bacterium]